MIIESLDSTTKHDLRCICRKEGINSSNREMQQSAVKKKRYKGEVQWIVVGVD